MIMLVPMQFTLNLLWMELNLNTVNTSGYLFQTFLFISNSLTSFINQMTIRFAQDIHTKQTVYVVCDLSGQCILLTTLICDAIAKVQEMWYVCLLLM